MEQFYEILNINEYSSRREIEENYQALKKEYTEKMFAEGEEGARAANHLRDLDIAYQDAIFALANRESSSSGGSKYTQVKEALDQKNLEKAQSLLDSYSQRDSEWHFYQANVFYEKQWFTDSKKQLEIALQLDPGNKKAQTTLDGLLKIMHGEEVERVRVEHQQRQQTMQQQPQMGGMGCTCCDCLCASLLCNSCGGC